MVTGSRQSKLSQLELPLEEDPKAKEKTLQKQLIDARAALGRVQHEHKALTDEHEKLLERHKNLVKAAKAIHQTMVFVERVIWNGELLKDCIRTRKALGAELTLEDS